MTCPIDLLPLAEPKDQNFPDGWFYENVAKYLVADTVRIMHNGLPIDLNKVHELELQLDSILEKVQDTIDNNLCIKEFLKDKYPAVAENLKQELQSKMRDINFYRKPFKANDMIHRSYYMSVFIEDNAETLYDIVTPIEEVFPGIPKWSARDVKPYAEEYHELKRLLKKTIDPNSTRAKEAMERLARDKALIYNKSYYQQIMDISFEKVMGSFNPASSKQKQELFEWLNIEPLAYSKETGLPSWGRDQIEELQRTEDEPVLLELYQAFIDHSFAAIVRNNFINAFYKYTILHNDGTLRLHGEYNLLGAKSGRYTSKKP